MPKTLLPQWLTPTRKATLIKLFSIYGNKCLLGHSVCSDYTHYILNESKAVWTVKTVYLPCIDSGGTPIKGKFLELFKSVRGFEQSSKYSRLYDYRIEQFITEWKSEDREQRRIDNRIEDIYHHNLSEPHKPLRGRFSAISKDIFNSAKPMYYTEGMGINILTFEPFIRIRISSSYERLYIGLGKVLRGVSKAKKRKAIRYGKPLPQTVAQTVNDLINKSVIHYLEH